MDESSDAVILSLIAVDDREIEVSSAAPEVVKVRDGRPSIIGEFRCVGVVQPFQKLVDQVDELRALVSVKKLIADSNEFVLQLFALFHGEVARGHGHRGKTTLGLL